MARMETLRADARRTAETSGERAFASPTPVTVPFAAAGALLALAAVVDISFGLSVTEQVALYAAASVAALAVLHRTLRSLSAGLALALIRPYAPGERVRLPLAKCGGDVEGVIVRIGAANTTLALDSGLLLVPNHRLLKVTPDC
jgi:small-conductance mechanosensitive channel